MGVDLLDLDAIKLYSLSLCYKNNEIYFRYKALKIRILKKIKKYSSKMWNEIGFHYKYI